MQRSNELADSETERGLLLGGKDLRQAGVNDDWSWLDDQTVSALPDARYVFLTVVFCGACPVNSI